MQLFTLPGRFVAVDSSARKCLVLPRIGGQKLEFQEIDLAADEMPLSPEEKAAAYSQEIAALGGVLTLQRGLYLVVVERVVPHATVLGKHEVLRIPSGGISLVPLSAKPLHADLPSSADRRREQKLLNMLSQLLSTSEFFMCRTLDLSHATQRLAQLGLLDAGKVAWKHVDTRFVWNAHMVTDFSDNESADVFFAPLINGLVETVTLNADTQLTLFSRRSRFRQGKRFTSRGLDREGRVSNFVETEQLVCRTEGDTQRVFSFVQTRGSIPVFWTHLCDLKYKPTIRIQGGGDSTSARAARATDAAFVAHFAEQMEVYGDQVCVNLVNQNGGEAKLEKAYQDATRRCCVDDDKEATSKADVSALTKRLRYEAFDFHHECRRMQWHNLDKLVARVDNEFARLGAFEATFEQNTWTVQNTQSGVFRVNCMDNLDRTNVVQSMFARRVLRVQLQQLGLDELLNKSSTAFEASVESTFRNLWADNADAMSIQYSGTPALKTDFTRTGKRSIAGALQDGVNSLRRYYMNNLCDGEAQDAIDILLGEVQASELAELERVRPTPRASSLKLHLCGAFFGALLASVLFAFLYDKVPSPLERPSLFVAGAAVFTYGYTRAVVLPRGRRFVDKPQYSTKGWPQPM
ncbi:MAG: hypothetical protein MHM6MM_006082 [Cercozoa sp. M6MM]